MNNSHRYSVPVPSEFRGMPYSEQFARIAEGRSLMQSAFGAAPTSFIPPYDTGDANTLSALSQLGFTVYSSDARENLKNGDRLTLEPMQVELAFNKENETFNFFVNHTESLLNDTRVHDIVVLYHYRTFTVNSTSQNIDPAKVAMLRDYIRYLKTKNVTFSMLNVTSPILERGTSSLNVTQASAQPTVPEHSGTNQILVVLALAAAALAIALLFGMKNQIS